MLGSAVMGALRRCHFHYHSDSMQVASGTADAIAKQLGFGCAAAMKEYIEKSAGRYRSQEQPSAALTPSQAWAARFSSLHSRLA